MATTFTLKKGVNQVCRPVLSVILLLLIKTQAFSQNVNIILDPAVTSTTVNATFSVTVRADFTSPGTLSVLEAYINFNPLDLEVVSTPVVAPAAITGLPSESFPFASVATMNTTGQVDYGRFISTPGGHPSADFAFFTVTFRALRVPPGGNTSLAFNLVPLRQTIALEGATVVLDQAIGATVNIAPACAGSTAVISNSATCNAQGFNLLLQSATGASPYDLTINGTTYNDIPVGGIITGFTPPSESLFPGNPVPASPDLNDGDDIEVGVKFSSSVAGFVKGVRFYKGSADPGTFVGKLYSYPAGALLASATFVTSPTGWQTVLFATPYEITANTTYMVTYYSSNGNYSSTDEFFNGNTVVSGSLTAPAGNSAVDNTSNGVYAFGGDAPGFPNSSYQNSSYSVDVVFSPAQYTFNLTSVTDATACTNTGALQTLTVTSTACSTLPVTLLNLSASPDKSNIIVRWATSTELNNKGFELQRSLDGKNNWQTIGFVNGAGNSNSIKNYSYTDMNLLARRYFYQLKQVDIDGRYKYSMVVAATINGKEGFNLEQNFPNPFKSQSTTIRFTLPRRTEVTLSLYDMSGRLLKVLVNGTKDAGTHAIPFDGNTLGAGVYYYQIQADGFTDSKKMNIQ